MLLTYRVAGKNHKLNPTVLSGLLQLANDRFFSLLVRNMKHFLERSAEFNIASMVETQRECCRRIQTFKMNNRNMIKGKRCVKGILTGISLAFALGNAHGHALVEDPPARNWFCGTTTKPDEVPNGVAIYPECEDAFANDQQGGYQFMSVLTHDRGRASVRPLPDNICGFNSESFNNRPTPWDHAADWPTAPMTRSTKGSSRSA